MFSAPAGYSTRSFRCGAMKAPGRPITRQCCGQLPVAARRLSSSQSQVSCVPPPPMLLRTASRHCCSRFHRTRRCCRAVRRFNIASRRRGQPPWCAFVRAAHVVATCTPHTSRMSIGVGLAGRWQAPPLPRSPTRSAPDRHMATAWSPLQQWSSQHAEILHIAA